MRWALAPREVIARNRDSTLHTHPGHNIHHAGEFAVGTDIGGLDAREVVNGAIYAASGTHYGAHIHHTFQLARYTMGSMD